MPSLPRLRIEHIYVIAALAIAGFVVALSTIVPHDFWWHMAIGRDIVQHGGIPTADRYSWALPANTPFTYQSWLSEVLFYLVHAVAGLPGIVWLRNGLYVAALAVLASSAWRRSGSWRLAALSVGGITLLTLNNMRMRPQSFSWLAFALFVTLLTAFRMHGLRSRVLLLLPLIMIAWVNLHGAFVMGIVLVSLTAGGETVKLLARRPDAPSLPRVRWLWIVAGLTVLATLANPKGLGVFAYVLDLLTAAPVQDLVGEWQPLPVTSILGVVFAATIFLSAGLWLRQQKPVDLTDLLLWAGFLWLALSAVRHVIWWTMLVWPMIAGHLAARPTRRVVRDRPTLVNTILALLLLALPLAVQPPFKHLWTLPEIFAGLGSHVPDGALIGTETPVEAVAWLREHPLPVGTRLFHDMGYGSYLIWAMPEQQVYVDPRIELYPLEEWLRYKRITAACNYGRELDQIGVTHLMLDWNGQRTLVTALDQDGGWRTLYDDESTIIYERIAPAAGGCAGVF